MAIPTITRAMADTYFATTPRQPRWAAIVDPEKDTSLTEAQVWLGQLCWDEKATCCGNTFDTSYTRAVSELALAIHDNPTALISTGVSTSGPVGAVKRQKLDALEIEYFEPSSSSASGSGGSGKGPLVLRTFPWLRDIIGCWLSNPYSSLRYRVRS